MCYLPKIKSNNNIKGRLIIMIEEHKDIYQKVREEKKYIHGAVKVNGEQQIRQWIRTRDDSCLQIARACLLGFKDWCLDKRSQGVALPSGNFFLWPPLFFTAWKLNELEMLNDELLKEIEKIAQELIKIKEVGERGTNNRSTHFGAGAAYAARLFPELAEAKTWKAFAEAIWDDWYRFQDTNEIGYNPRHLEALITLAEGLDKTELLFNSGLINLFIRYRDQISPEGLVVFPGDENPFSQHSHRWDLSECFERAAFYTKDPTMLWAAFETFLAGHRLDGPVPEDKKEDALEERFGYLLEMGLRPEMPKTESQIQFRYQATGHPMADHLVFSPSRQKGTPFAMFDLYDSGCEIQHVHENQKGELLYYEVDGIPLIHHLAYGMRQAHEANIVLVTDPEDQFPGQYATPVVEENWQRASSDLRYTVYQRASDSYPEIPDEYGKLMDKKAPELGFFYYNPDAIIGKLDEINVNSITIYFLLNKPGDPMSAWAGHAWQHAHLDPAPAEQPVKVVIDNVRLTGPGGELKLEDFSTLNDRLEFTYLNPDIRADSIHDVVQYRPEYSLSPAEMRKWIGETTATSSGRKGLEITCRQGTNMLTLNDLDLDINIRKQYTRLEFDYKYIGDTSRWKRVPIVLKFDHQGRPVTVNRHMGGHLVDTHVEQVGKDSYGYFTYHNYFAPGTKLTRRSILTREGILIVRDEIIPEKGAAGLLAGPIWHVFNQPEMGSNWFDVKTKERAENCKKLLIYFDGYYSKDHFVHRYGCQLMPQRDNSLYTVYANDLLKAKKCETFLTVMVPHDNKLSGKEIADTISTRQKGDNNISIKFENVIIELDNKGNWKVRR